MITGRNREEAGAVLSLSDWLASLAIQYLPAVARVAGMASVAPVFASALLPPLAKVGLVAGLSIATCAAAPPLQGDLAMGAVSYLGALLAEVVLGMAIGLGARLLLDALDFAGQVLDLQVGLRAGVFFDPASGRQTSPLGQVYSIVGTVLFLELNGHHWLLSGLAATFRYVTPGQISLGPHLWGIIVGLGASIFRLALQVGAPVMLTLFLVDLVFGVAARAIPQMNVFIVELPAKFLAGFVAMLLCAPLLLGVVASLIEDMNDYVLQLVHLAGG